MKIALASFRYFPYGGLERDLMRVANCALSRGHEVTLFTGKIEGELPAGLQTRLVELDSCTNHGRAAEFAARFPALLKAGDFAVSAAFNRIPGCDFYFAADNCYAAEMPKKHSRLILNLLPRYRTYLKLEKSALAPPSATRIWYIAPAQKRDYQKCYGIPDERFLYLPPGIDPRCRRGADAEAKRAQKRAELSISSDQKLALMVASNFALKGGERALRALAQLPKEVILAVAGDFNPRRWQQFADRLGVGERVIFLGARNDVPDLLLAADVLIHPAIEDAAGAVLAEAISSGCPVITSGVCGFAPLVADADGVVIGDEASWDQAKFEKQFNEVIAHAEARRAAAIEYSAKVDFTRRAEVAVDQLEQLAAVQA